MLLPLLVLENTQISTLSNEVKIKMETSKLQSEINIFKQRVNWIFKNNKYFST